MKVSLLSLSSNPEHYERDGSRPVTLIYRIAAGARPGLGCNFIAGRESIPHMSVREPYSASLMQRMA